MNKSAWILGIVLGCALFAPAALSADELDQEVQGRLLAVDPSNGARGDFEIDSRRSSDGVRGTVSVTAARLGTRPDLDGTPAQYRAVLIDAHGGVVDFGALRLDRDGHASLRFDSGRSRLPTGASAVTDFGGGEFELRRAGAPVLRGAIPRFVGIGERGSDVARAFFQGGSRVRATLNGGAGRGAIDARAWSGKRRGEERLSISVDQIGRLGNPFTVVVLDGRGVATTLGTITTRGGSGAGSLLFDTRSGGAVPGGGLVVLSGRAVEVRNSVGTVVLTGTFPSVP